jgi:photosystem II stability/assembly factor-like uncharacterized protein
VATSKSGVFRSSDFGVVWTPASAGLTNTYVWSLVVADSSLFAGTYGGGVFLSTNGGASWSPVGDELSHSYVLSLAVDGQNIFAGTLEGIFFLSDDRLSWKPVNNGLTNVYVRTLAVNKGRIFAGTYGGGIFLSTDKGASWTARNYGLTDYSILNFAFLASHVFAGTYGGIFRSNESVTSWAAVAVDSTSVPAFRSQPRAPEFATEGTSKTIAALTPKAVYSLAVNGSDVYVGTYGMGVLRSTDDGRSWGTINSGLENLDLNMISILGGNIYAGALDGQIWRLRLPDTLTDGGQSSDDIPAHIKLDQNYPNPFNPTTAISFQLSAVGDVKLVVHDILGREMTVLVNEKKAPGSYRVTFNGSGLASGVYFYTLRAGGFADTKRFVLLK